MKVEDDIYIERDGIVMRINIQAWQTLSEDSPQGTVHPREISYSDEAKKFAAALEEVREALVELDETPDEDNDE